MFLMKEIIAKKRDKNTLSKEEIDFFVQGVVSKQVNNEQISALAMAILLNDISMEEKINLTLAMRDSGEVIRFKNLTDKPIVDKHSTGGVSDSVSLALAPIVASLGAYVPMITGKGLGHTGGTTDKLDSIIGYNTSPDMNLFAKTVKEVGCAVIGQTQNLAPADKIIYGVRDTTGTVESIPLIASSILSKKLASGIDYLVMDVKTGSGAFMQNFEDSCQLAQDIVDIAQGAGVKTNAFITDMNEALGRNIGNSLEIVEIIEYLKGEKVDSKLHFITKALAKRMLIITGIFDDEEILDKKIEEALASGKPAEIFEKMVANLGGDSNILANYQNILPKAKYKKEIFAKKEGFIKSIDTKSLGMLLVHLGGGRKDFTDKINYAVGLEGVVKVSEEVNKNKPIAIIHYEKEEQFEAISSQINNIFEISEDKEESNIKAIYKEIK